MRRTVEILAVLVAAWSASSVPLPAQNAAPAAIVVNLDGTPVDADIFVWTSKKPESVGTTGSDGQATFSTPLLQGKGVAIASGTPMTVYRLTCADGKIRLLLAPTSVAKNQLGCADRNNPVVPGQACSCSDPVGTVVWGPDMRVGLSTGGGGWSTNQKLLVFGGGAAVAAGVLIAKGGEDAAAALSTFSGTYSGTFSQTSTTCNPAAFVPSFTGSAIFTIVDSGQTSMILRESIDRTYNGTVTRTGGTLTGSGAFPSGTPWTGVVQVTFAEGTPVKATVEETITNVSKACNAKFLLGNAPKQ